MRMPFAPFCPYLPLLLLFVSASVVSLLCFYSGLLSLFPAVLLRCSFLCLVSRRFELSPSLGVHLFLLLPWGGLFIGLHLLSLVSSSLFSCVGFWFLRFFCLVQISGSLRNMVSLWDESRFAVSSLLLSSLASFCISFPLGHLSFQFYDTFESAVPLATWSLFWMSQDFAVPLSHLHLGSLLVMVSLWGRVSVFFCPLPPLSVVVFRLFALGVTPGFCFDSFSRSIFGFPFWWGTTFRPRSLQMPLPSLSLVSFRC